MIIAEDELSFNEQGKVVYRVGYKQPGGRYIKISAQVVYECGQIPEQEREEFLSNFDPGQYEILDAELAYRGDKKSCEKITNSFRSARFADAVRDESGYNVRVTVKLSQDVSVDSQKGGLGLILARLERIGIIDGDDFIRLSENLGVLTSGKEGEAPGKVFRPDFKNGSTPSRDPENGRRVR